MAKSKGLMAKALTRGQKDVYMLLGAVNAEQTSSPTSYSPRKVDAMGTTWAQPYDLVSDEWLFSPYSGSRGPGQHRPITSSIASPRALPAPKLSLWLLLAWRHSIELVLGLHVDRGKHAGPTDTVCGFPEGEGGWKARRRMQIMERAITGQ